MENNPCKKTLLEKKTKLKNEQKKRNYKRPNEPKIRMFLKNIDFF
jgi:hypothetical protein